MQIVRRLHRPQSSEPPVLINRSQKYQTPPPMQPPAAQNRPQLHFNHAAEAPKCWVVLIGASVRSAAQSARAGGFKVIGLDQFGDRDTIAACHEFAALDDAPRVAELLLRYPDAPVIQVGGLSGLDNWLVVNPVARPRLSISLDTVQKLAMPDILRNLARQSGFRFPETSEANDVTIRRLIRERTMASAPVRRRWLFKPTGGSGGVGIHWFHPDFRPQSPGWFQEWVPGRSFGATLRIRSGSTNLLGVCRSSFHRLSSSEGQAPFPTHPFVYAGSYGPIAIFPHLADALRLLGAAIFASSQLEGLCNVDFLVDRNDQPWLVEINPRWSGSSELIERALKIESLMGAVIRPDEHPAFSQKDETGAPLMKKVIFARRTFRFRLPEFAKMVMPSVQVADVPEEGSEIGVGMPACSLIGNPGDVSRASRNMARQLAIL